MASRFGSALTLAHVTPPLSSPVDSSLLYVKADRKLWLKDQAGTETLVGPVEGAGPVDWADIANKPATMPATPESISMVQLSDMDGIASTDGQLVTWDSAASRWRAKSPAVQRELILLAELKDVRSLVPNTGQVLAWSGTEWQPENPTVPEHDSSHDDRFSQLGHTHAAPPAPAVQTPIGSIVMWTTATPPAGWLKCDGTAIPGQYTELIALVGTLTPNLQGRMPIGVGVGGTTPSLLQTGGDWSHQHNQTSHVHSVGGSGGLTTNTTGSSHTHVVPNIASSGSHDHGGGTIQTNTTTGGTANRVSVVPSSGSGHTHVVNDTTTTGSGHTHDLAGHNHPDTGNGSTGGSNDPTGAANPPFLGLNFIIRAA